MEDKKKKSPHRTIWIDCRVTTASHANVMVARKCKVSEPHPGSRTKNHDIKIEDAHAETQLRRWQCIR